MIESASGIILRTRPLTETSLIVNWLTAAQGRISTVAKGARRPKSSFAGKLDLFYEVDFSFTRSRRSDLHALREVSLRTTHTRLREDLGWLQQAGYAAALVEQTTERETPLPGIYQLFHGFLDYLPQQPPQPRTLYAFELKLLDELGLKPDPDDLKLSAEAGTLIATLSDAPWEDLPTLKTSANTARELRKFLHGFLIFHLGKIPSSRP